MKRPGIYWPDIEKRKYAYKALHEDLKLFDEKLATIVEILETVNSLIAKLSVRSDINHLKKINRAMVALNEALGYNEK